MHISRSPNASKSSLCAIAGEGPAQGLAVADGVVAFAVGDHRAVGQQLQPVPVDLDRLAARRQPLAVQTGVDLADLGLGDAERVAKGAAKGLGPLAPAIEAGTMPGGERRHLVEEEQFGPAGFAAGADCGPSARAAHP